MIKRFITVPQDIPIVELATGRPITLPGDEGRLTLSFKTFILGTVLNDPRFGKTVATVMQAAEIRSALLTEPNDRVIVLNSDTHELLKTIVEAPEGGYKPDVAVQIIPFFKAVLDAPTTDPRKAAE